MTKLNKGFTFHAHHDILWEWCEDYEGRVADIHTNKLAEEQDLRLKLFRLIPPERVPPVLRRARRAYDEAWAAYEKAEAVRAKALAAYDEAWDAYHEAWDAHQTGMFALHKELCPNCPWNGKTIFPQKAKAL